MVQKVSSLKAEDLSPSDCDSHPEDKEISDDDDDDRNHKHRRRETHSLSTERDQIDQVQNRPNRKRNKPFDNGNSFRENDSQSSEPWKRRPPFSTFNRGLNRDNQLFSQDLALGRGRGNELSSWIHRDPRFSSVIASQMGLPRPIPPNMFAGMGGGRGLAPQGSSWGSYGLIPGVLNGGLDSLHPLGLQGALRPSINSSQNINIMHQRCRDFEERGFCLRGDMCPMEHGVNRIVIEDVQSLSQFNLPVSLPTGHPLGSSSALPSVGTSSTTINSNILHNKNGKPEINDAGLTNGADASDFYDPDQPLWANECPGPSTSFQGLNSTKFDENAWGGVGTKNNKSEIKRKFDSTPSSSHSDPDKAKKSQKILANIEHATPEGKISSQNIDISSKKPDPTQPNFRKPNKKALRTLFVSCIPKEDNNIQALLSHFKRFGEIIDIYIPHSCDRAFVQFSKREEAEGALKAPDAVMGNRFIKLLWANRDRITDDAPSSGNNASFGPPNQNFAQKGKNEIRPAVMKLNFPHSSVSPVPSPKPVTQKKPGNLALLEEFRKRQESFSQKRDALQRELAKLEKKAAGPKGEVASEQLAKRQKIEVVADSAKAEALNSSDIGTKIASPQAEAAGQENSMEIIEDKRNLKKSKTMELHEMRSLNQSIRPLAPPGAPFGLNRFKLDNRPSAFRISPPLPPGLENIDVLKEHFSSYGELSSVELEDGNSSDSASPNNFSALIFFKSRRSAEKAFINGKNWQGNTLQFVWLASNNSSIENSNKEKPSSASEASTAISAESGNLGNKNNNGECVEKGEDLRSSSSSVSGDL